MNNTTSFEIVSVNLSEAKGTVKHPVASILLTPEGIAGDAHAGRWHRQVSLLGVESMEKMTASLGRTVHPGEFAENITTRGIILHEMKPLDRLIAGDVILEVTQIGKKCHGEKCAIYQTAGDCVMPREGIFCRVIRGGQLQRADRLMYEPKVLNVKVITLSDRASRGEYEDRSGPLLIKLVGDFFTSAGRHCETERIILPDDPVQLEAAVRRFTAEGADILFTSGGTGIGPRDITPDVIRPLFTREIPGIMELIRVKYGMNHPGALISRSVAGLIDRTLVYTLPGSPKAVQEYTAEIFGTIEHSLRMIHEIDSH